jgi:hypothetical protein
MAKNIFVTFCCEIINSGLCGDRDTFPAWKKITDISVNCVKKNNPGLFDEYIIVEGQYQRNVDMLRDKPQILYEIWKSKKCNLFYMGSDCFCTGSLKDILNTDKMMMYSTTEGLPPDFNGDVIYFPYTMNELLFTECCTKMNDTRWEIYGFEQSVFSDAFRSQFKTLEEAYEEIRKFGFFGKYNYSSYNLFKEEGSFDTCVIQQHWGTRGIENLLNIAEKFCKV